MSSEIKSIMSFEVGEKKAVESQTDVSVRINIELTKKYKDELLKFLKYATSQLESGKWPPEEREPISLRLGGEHE